LLHISIFRFPSEARRLDEKCEGETPLKAIMRSDCRLREYMARVVRTSFVQ
jgi:hypothetical protein